MTLQPRQLRLVLMAQFDRSKNHDPTSHDFSQIPNYIDVQTQYDAVGRAYKTSNPFRPWNSETAIWTTTSFDALSRVISITTPDNATVTTSYLGNTVTATDQAGEQRKSVSDALGRLTSVYEDPSGLNYQTSYTYDTSTI